MGVYCCRETASNFNSKSNLYIYSYINTNCYLYSDDNTHVNVNPYSNPISYWYPGTIINTSALIVSER